MVEHDGLAACYVIDKSLWARGLCGVVMKGFSRALVTGGAGFIGSHLVDRLMDMAAQGFNSQQIFDSGKLSGRTLRAIGKQAYCSIVRTFPTAIVHTIEHYCLFHKISPFRILSVKYPVITAPSVLKYFVTGTKCFWETMGLTGCR